MTITKTTNGEEITLALSGRLDSVTAPELESTVKACYGDAGTIVMDLSELDYTSSAGLRIFLGTHKLMAGKKGTMTIRGANEDVCEVFKMTGMYDIFNIE